MAKTRKWQWNAAYCTRILTLSITMLALGYGFLAGMHTVSDPDSGWQLATGRYLLQNHSIPFTDVLSYTSAGEPFVYPPFAGVFFYPIFLLGGWAALSWLCALVSMLIVWLTIRRGGIVAASLAIFAAPLISYRCAPRGDLFTTVFFAWLFIGMWRHLRGGKFPLWTLPLTMFLWANLHTGFVVGFAVMGAYLLAEATEMLWRERRAAAWQRMRQSLGWMAAAALATLVNPWGIRIYGSPTLNSHGLSGAVEAGGHAIGEFAHLPTGWLSILQAADPRNPDGSFWWLALAALLCLPLAIWLRRLAAVPVLCASFWFAFSHLRYEALFAIVVLGVCSELCLEYVENRHKRAVAASAVPEIEDEALRGEEAVLEAPSAGAAADEIPMEAPETAASSDGAENTVAENTVNVEKKWRTRGKSWCGVLRRASVCLLLFSMIVLGVLRSIELVDGRTYAVYSQPHSFGAGEGWWFPEQAAAFVEREQLPGNLYQDYNMGGFLAFRLGPKYKDFIDGRNVDGRVTQLAMQLAPASPDSDLWLQTADRYNINVVLFSLARFGGLSNVNLGPWCGSQHWRPVYLDAFSIVFLRNTPANQPWLAKFGQRCVDHKFPPPQEGSNAELFNFYANAAAVEYVMGRDAVAINDLKEAEERMPVDANVNLTRAQIYMSNGMRAEAEQQYREANAKHASEVSWGGLAQILLAEGDNRGALAAVHNATQLSYYPAPLHLFAAQIEMRLQQPDAALEDLAKAESAPSPAARDAEFNASVDSLRATACQEKKQYAQAAEWQGRALQLTPKVAGRWHHLAIIYTQLGNNTLAQQAEAQARQLEPPPQPSTR